MAAAWWCFGVKPGRAFITSSVTQHPGNTNKRGRISTKAAGGVIFQFSKQFSSVDKILRMKKIAS